MERHGKKLNSVHDYTETISQRNIRLQHRIEPGPRLKGVRGKIPKFIFIPMPARYKFHTG